MNEQPSTGELFELLAASVHDMKNSLQLLQGQLARIQSECHLENCDAFQDFTDLRYETRRMSDHLAGLLTMYKLGQRHYTPMLDFYPVADLLDDLVVSQQAVLSLKGITVAMECPPTLTWSFDWQLVYGMLGSVLNNTYRYAHSQVRLTAQQQGSCLQLTIEDDGPGFPTKPGSDDPDDADGPPPQRHTDGTSTGLGLYFARVVAHAHSHQGHHGWIEVDNASTLGGGAFRLYLP